MCAAKFWKGHLRSHLFVDCEFALAAVQVHPFFELFWYCLRSCPYFDFHGCMRRSKLSKDGAAVVGGDKLNLPKPFRGIFFPEIKRIQKYFFLLSKGRLGNSLRYILITYLKVLTFQNTTNTLIMNPFESFLSNYIETLEYAFDQIWQRIPNIFQSIRTCQVK